MNTMSRAQQAADWFLRLREDVSEEELREWTQWCAADRENLREYERVGATWRAIGRVKPAVVPWISRARIAALACLSLGLLGWLVWQTDLLHRNKQVFAAQQPVNRSATLPDGSTLVLAPRSKVAVDFSGPVRNLNLSQGEAYFNVRPNKVKPFVVQAYGLKVTAIGTAFSIKSKGRKVIVTVEEGTVEAAHGAEVWRVGGGQQIDYSIDRNIAQIASVDPRRELGWREGRLEYFNQPLALVVADAQRYSARRIEITDARLRALTYTGTVFTQSVDDWLLAVESTFPIRVDRRSDRVLLEPRSAQPVQ
jgi:transmembrane sensor